MTADIINLAAHKKVVDALKDANRKLHEQGDAERYFCLKCDMDQFRLYSTGQVHCASCAAQMSNLSVRDTAP